MTIELSVVLSFLGGIASGVIVMYKYVASRITLTEAQTIYQKISHVVEEYKNATADGAITTEEKLRIAEDVISAMEEIVKDLQ